MRRHTEIFRHTGHFGMSSILYWCLVAICPMVSITHGQWRETFWQVLYFCSELFIYYNAWLSVLVSIIAETRPRRKCVNGISSKPWTWGIRKMRITKFDVGDGFSLLLWKTNKTHVLKKTQVHQKNDRPPGYEYKMFPSLHLPYCRTEYD